MNDPASTLLEAVDIAADNDDIHNYKKDRYFYGICWRMIKAES